MNFFELVKRSPDVLDLYLEKARKFQYNFFFNTEDDTIFFHELLEKVFYPDGITVEAFHQLVSTSKMTEFSFQAASSFKTWVYFLTKTLSDQLPEALVPQLWDRVSKCAYPTAFQQSLSNHPPRNLKDFAKTIENRATVFRDREPTNGLRQQSTTLSYASASDRSPTDAPRLMQTTSTTPGYRDRGRAVHNISTRDSSNGRTFENSPPDLNDHYEDYEDSEDD